MSSEMAKLQSRSWWRSHANRWSNHSRLRLRPCLLSRLFTERPMLADCSLTMQLANEANDNSPIGSHSKTRWTRCHETRWKKHQTWISRLRKDKLQVSNKIFAWCKLIQFIKHKISFPISFPIFVEEIKLILINWLSVHVIGGSKLIISKNRIEGI